MELGAGKEKHLPTYINILKMAVAPDVETAKQSCVYSKTNHQVQWSKVNPIK
jgi:hypothetical protein